MSAGDTRSSESKSLEACSTPTSARVGSTHLMLFQPTELAGVMLVDLKQRDDDRGFFARAFCVDEFAAQETRVACRAGKHVGEPSGRHDARPPFPSATAPEAKFFRCIAGETFHVAVDARPDSPSFGSWVGARLSAAEHRALYIPPLFAAGYQALTDGAEVLYLCCFLVRTVG